MSLRCQLHVTRPTFVLEAELSFPEPAFVAVLGPSGSGKTTLLRCIAGLERNARAHILWRDREWQTATRFLPPHLRPIGYVFQEASLFPHLDVRGNLLFGQQRKPGATRSGRVPLPRGPACIDPDEVVTLLGLEHLLARKPDKLSGGERQRVAIGRALLTNPELLLFDEPLASLDLESRAQIMPYLMAVHERLQVHVLYVTHTPREVVRLADQIVYLNDGVVRAHGPINEVLTRPDLPLCRDDEAGAALDAEVMAYDPDFHLMSLALGTARLSVSRRDVALGARVRVHIRARDVGLSLSPPEHTSILNVLHARVLDIHEERDPAHRLVRLDAAGHVLLARVTYRAAHQLHLAAGDMVYAHVKSVALAE